MRAVPRMPPVTLWTVFRASLMNSAPRPGTSRSAIWRAAFAARSPEASSTPASKMERAKTTSPKPTEAELAILQVLWSRGPSTVRQVQDAVQDRRSWGYTTVLKLLQIMAEKGLVTRDESARAHTYQAQRSQEQTQTALVGDLLDRAFEGSASKLVLQALSQTKASPEELAETDIASYALDALRESRVREVLLVGRRGPAQAAFTNPEVKELGELADTETTTLADEMELDDPTRAEIEKDRSLARKIEILQSVYFRTGKTKLRRRSFKLLRNVAQVLNAHGHIKVQVEGHTDSRGKDEYNMDLSQRRAQARPGSYPDGRPRCRHRGPCPGSRGSRAGQDR